MGDGERKVEQIKGWQATRKNDVQKGNEEEYENDLNAEEESG